MKKSKKKIILFVLLLLLLAFVLLLVGGSYSRYLTQVEGKGVIQIAKWAFLVNGQTATITNLNLANTYHSDTLVENRIAPGTNGSFDIIIDTTGSEVGIDYEVKFTNEQSKPQNLQFSYDGHKANTIKELEEFLKGTVEANSKEKIKTMTIEWNWPYETGNVPNEKILADTKDTQDGKALQQYQFDITITGTQVQPVA